MKSLMFRERFQIGKLETFVLLKMAGGGSGDQKNEPLPRDLKRIEISKGTKK